MTRSRTNLRWYYLGVTLATLWLVSQFDKINVSVLIADKAFLQDLKLINNPSKAGALMSIFFVGYALGVLVWGFVVDHIGPRLSALASVAMWCVVMFWAGTSSSINGLLVARFILGIAEGALWPVSNAYTSFWFPVKEHSRFQMIWVNAIMLGSVIGVPLTTAIVLTWGWRENFYFYAVLPLLTVVPMLVWLTRDRPSQMKGISPEEVEYIESGRTEQVFENEKVSHKFTDALKDPRIFFLIIAHSCIVITAYGLITWLPSYLINVHKFSLARMSMWVSGSNVVPIMISFVFGYYADRTLRRALIALFGAIGFCLMLGLLMTVNDPLTAVVLVVLAYFPVAVLTTMNASMMTSFVKRTIVGRSTGFVIFMSNLLGSFGPLMMGYLIGVGGYNGAFLFLIGANLLAAVFYFLLSLRERNLPVGVMTQPEVVQS